MGESAEEGKEIDAIKQKTDALGREILQMENQGATLIKKEIGLEDRLVAVLGQMLELEKGKIADAKRSGAAKEAALMGRIAALQNKQREFEKRKEMVKHLKEKSSAIKDEMANAERKMREEIAELYRIKEIKKKHAVEKAAQKAAKAAAKKAVKKPQAALKLKKAVPAKKPAGKAKKAKLKVKAVKKVLKKKAVKRAKPKKAAAVKKAVVEKPVKIKKPKAKKAAFLEELPEEEEEVEEEGEEAVEEEAAPEEEAVEEEAPAEEAVAEEEEAPAGEEAAEEEAAPEEEVAGEEGGEEAGEEEAAEEPAEEQPSEEEAPAAEEAKEEQPSALLERVLEKAKKEKVTEGETAAGEEAEAKQPADYDFTEFSSVDFSISHPDWPEKEEAAPNALLSRETGNFSFDLLQIPAQGRSVDDVVAQATAKIESNIGSRVLEKKKTGDKAFFVYSESRNGMEFLNKAIFVLHEDKIFKLVFSAPTEEFDKINDIFWKAAKSISFK